MILQIWFGKLLGRGEARVGGMVRVQVKVRECVMVGLGLE